MLKGLIFYGQKVASKLLTYLADVTFIYDLLTSKCNCLECTEVVNFVKFPKQFVLIPGSQIFGTQSWMHAQTANLNM